MTWCAVRNAAAEHKTNSNMISFGVMTVLLAVMACVVHYDLFGLFPSNPYGRNARDERRQEQQHKQQHKQQQQERETSEPRDDKGPYYEHVMDRPAFDDAWLPRPGTDPHTMFQRPTIVVNDYGDYRPAAGREDYWIDDDYWTEVQTDGEADDREASDDDDDDDDESWTKVTTDDGAELGVDDESHGAPGTDDLGVGAGDRGPGASDTCRAPPIATVASEGCEAESTVVEPLPMSPLRSFVDDPDDDYEYDEDYMAPGEERDDDVF